MSIVLCVRMIIVSAVLFVVFFAETAYKCLTLRATSILTFFGMLFWFVERRGGAESKFWSRDLVRLDFRGENGQPALEDVKKVDENGNALHQNQSSKAKKKKVPSEKNVMTSYSAEKLEGHRSEIINDIDKLLAYIGDGKDSSNTNKQKKQSHKNSPDESTNKGGGGKKQKGGGGGGASQAASSKNSKGDLKKSNSLEEISTTKMNSFKFDDDRNEAKDHQQQKEEQEKPKGAKNNETVNEKPKVEVTVVKKPKTDVIVLESPPERRNREAVEPTVTNVPKAAAPAPSEATADASADFRVVTKKKKTKKRRNSVSGSRHKPSTGACSASAGSNLSKLDGGDRPSSTAGGRRASSPAKVPPRRKSVCSVPQSDKSNDSSDADSVHSLPAGGASCAAQRAAAVVIDDAPISYADIARNADRRTQDPQVPTTTSTVTTTASSNAQAPKKPAETQPAVTAGSNAHAPKKFADAKVGRDSLSDQGSPPKAATSQQTAWTAEPASTANAQTQTTPPKEQQPPPDVHNIRSFPAIGNNKGAGGGGTIKVDRSVNTAVTRSQVGVASGRSQQQQQQQQQQQAERQRVAQCNAANSSATGRTVRTQTVGTSMQTNNVPEQQMPPRDIKTDLSIIQANEMETVQYNNQMMPRMEIPDVQTIEKLNYMSQPGAHMPLHLQHHVVPPQHLHMAPPPQQRPPSQPPHHIPMMMQPPPPPDMYHPHHHHPQQVYNPVMTHPHHHPHHHNQYHPQQHHHLAYSPQAYEGVAVTYAVDPAYMPQGGVVGQHHQMMGGVVDNRSQEAVQNAPREKTSGRWADDNANKPPKSSNNKKRFDKSHNPVDRRKDNVAPSRSPSQPTSHSNQAVIASAQRGGVGPAHHHHNNNNNQNRRGGRGAEPARRDEANCDNHDANASNDCGGASSGDETGSDRPPPVVILSGSSASRDVPGGIEFGFAVNPDLVDDDGVEAVESSDPCEVFDRYYRPPDNSGAESYNHDKVVHYIGSTWEDILNSGTAQYYSSPRNPNNNNNNNNN